MVTGRLFLTGMFRSGTTFLSRMIHAHPEAAVASDPYAEIFKAFRNEIALREIGHEALDPAAPLDDYYLDPVRNRFMSALQSSPFETSLAPESLRRIRDRVRAASKPYSPLLGPHISALSGSNYGQVIESGLRLIADVYGDRRTRIAGFKEVWAGEFVSHFLKYFRSSRAIHIIRDPRAVAASKNAREAKYPWLFMARQWRKLAAFAWRDKNNSEYSSSVHIIRYEDIVRDPGTEAQRICDFLGVPFDVAMLNPDEYVDGEGKPWRQNSAHFSGRRTFNPASVDKWRETLPKRECQLIEAVCGPEMELFGYEPITSSSWRDGIDPDLIWAAPRIDPADLADWIRPYVTEMERQTHKAMALEHVRLWQIASGVEPDNRLKRLVALDEALFDRMAAGQASEDTDCD